MTALTRSGKGHYLIGGVKYPSVTTILGAGVPKPALTSWAAKSVAEYAVKMPSEWIPIAKRDQQAAIDLLKGTPWRDRDRGASLGSALHSAIEADTLGLPCPSEDPDVLAMVDQYHQWVERVGGVTWELSEATVVNRTLGYAGTLDGVMRLGDKVYIVDVKTSKQGRQGHGLYPEIALQLAAYHYAEAVCLPDGTEVPMPDVDGALGLWIRPDRCHAYDVEAGPDALRAFGYAMGVAQWTWDDSTAWVGAEVMG